MFEAEPFKQEALEQVVVEVDQPPPEKLVSLVKPSARFLQWTSELQVSGVRKGVTPKVMLNGLTFGVGATVDRRLGIVFEGLSENDTVLVFRDKTAAMLTKEF
jgi:hypothetical protein